MFPPVASPEYFDMMAFIEGLGKSEGNVWKCNVWQNGYILDVEVELYLGLIDS